MHKRATAPRFVAAATALALIGVAGAARSGNAAASTSTKSTSSSLDPRASKMRDDALAHSQVPDEVRSGAARAVADVVPTQKLRLALGLTRPDPAGEDRLVAELSDKHSPRFHHFFTASQWTARFSPSRADEQAVVDWARHAGLTVTHRYPNRLVVDVVGNVATIERAFGVRLREYRAGAKSFYSNDAEPQLPASVSSLVHSFDGLNDIQQMHTSARMSEPASPRFVAGPSVQAAPAIDRNATAAGPRPSITGGNYDPTDIYSSQAYDFTALYNQGHCCNPFHNPTTGSPIQSSIAIATFGDQDPNDFTGFHNAYPYLSQSIRRYYIDGTPAVGDNEGTLDAEWATASSNSFGCYCDTARVHLYDGANTSNSTFTDIYNQMVSDNLARVFSTSWSCTEFYGCSYATMDTRHGIFASMVGQGWTLVTASGDRGAYDDCSHLAASYPASDPDVLGVGGTDLQLNSSSNFVSETAWQSNSFGCSGNGGGSGGGCSFHFAKQSYDSIGACGSQRSVPDLSLNSDWLNAPQNYYFGFLQGTGGTSIAAPEMAGFFAQENAYQLSFGSGPLGIATFPVWAAGKNLSQPHNAFYDTTSGCNGISSTQTGYCAGTGYDLVTGFGSVNMLMLAWDMNWFTNDDAGRPNVLFGGATTNLWYRSNQAINWEVDDTGGGEPVTGVAGYSYAWDQSPGDPYSHATPGSGDTFYSGPQFPNSTTGVTNLAVAGQGCHILHVYAWDNMGYSNLDQVKGYFCYDTVAPTISSAPHPTLLSGGRVTSGGVPVTISWAGHDASSGIQHYSLQHKTDSGAYQNVTLDSSTETSQVVRLTPGHSHTFRITATDVAGNTSGYATGAGFKVNLVQENGGVVYSPGWTRQAVSGASGGSVDFTTVNGKTAKYTFTGNQIAWVATKGTKRSVGSVQIDSGSPTSVDTQGISTSNPAIVVFVRTFGSKAKHTITVKDLATSGRPRLDVDAFVYLS